MLLRGLKRSYDRCADAHAVERMPASGRDAIAEAHDPREVEELRQWASVPDPEQAPLAVQDFLGCAYSLEMWLSEQEKVTGTDYESRRDRDPDGRFLLGMRFARDRHAHQGTLTAATAFTWRYWQDAEGNVTGPVLLPAQFTWRNLVDVAEPDDGRQTTNRYLKLRAAYEADLAGRLALPTLEAVLRFLTAEFRSRGIE